VCVCVCVCVSWSQRTLELFKEATGLGPEDKPSVWDQWRCDCVTALLRDIRRTAKSLRPQLVLSAAVAVDRKEALSRFQVTILLHSELFPMRK
jgi:uncharacterized lipoprotein YddW (UPF0748 family)